MVVLVTGKKCLAGVPECSQDTVSESFNVDYDQEAVKMFDRNNPGYTAVRETLLGDAKREMQSFKRKYSILSELAPVFAAIEAVS